MINRTLRYFLAIGVLLVLSALSAGCGSSSSTSSGSADSTAENASAEGISAFLKPGSPTNKLVRFGSEAPAKEREAAAVALAETLEAREEGDFEKQCETSSLLVAKSITSSKTGAGAEKNCPRELRELAVPLNKTKPFRVDTFDGEIVALRVKGKKAEALYHGNDGKDYAMPMSKEGDSWKVAALLTTELNPPETEKQKEGGKAQKEAGNVQSGAPPSKPAN